MPALRPCLTCNKLSTNGTRCPECTRARQRARDAARGSAGLRGYDATYRRHRRIILVDNPRCTYCPAPATTVDHKQALSSGGDNSLDNLVPSCGPCNFSRGAKLGNARRYPRGRMDSWPW